MERMEGSDARDIERARTGDPEGFRALVERHSRAVFRLAYRMTGNEHDAEDVVQETFLRAYRRLDQFESRSQFSSWLYRIAANCSFDVLRGRARGEEHLQAQGDDDDPAAELPATEPAPDRLVFSDQVRRQLLCALQRMSPLERAAFVLRHFEERSIREIGETLGLDVSAAKHSIFRAVRKLRRALEPAMNQGGTP
jgi:RNA polymerase sigma-70 factor, ECF subfamily